MSPVEQTTEQTEDNESNPVNKNSGAYNSNPNSNVNKIDDNNSNHKTVTKPRESRRLFAHPLRHVQKQDKGVRKFNPGLKKIIEVFEEEKLYNYQPRNPKTKIWKVVWKRWFFNNG